MSPRTIRSITAHDRIDGLVDPFVMLDHIGPDELDMAADSDTHVFHEVQLWVNLPAAHKMQPPSITSVHRGDKPILDRGHYRVEVITGTIGGQTSTLGPTQPTTVARIQMTGPGPIAIDDIDGDWNAVAYVLRGSIDAAGHVVEQYRSVLEPTPTSCSSPANPSHWAARSS